MSSYYANRDLAGYQAAQEGYQTVHEAWQTSEAQRQTDYQALHDQWQTEADRRNQANTTDQQAYDAAHAAWEANGGLDDAGQPCDPPLEPVPLELPPEPQPPEPQPEPQPPAPPPVYTSREVTEPETISTPTGEALVVPPRVVLTDSAGRLAAISEEELAAAYTAAATQGEVPTLEKGALIA